jgi:hypothetical protein
MKLLKTIHKLIEEAEDNFYNASLSSDNIKELELLEKKLDDAFELLERYKKLN